ncbi:MAG TPA: ATP-binding protein [Gemmatimonadaceae bacterium]|nr:ATP-binding protein [Gemmatimonadaceae bacterium]
MLALASVPLFLMALWVRNPALPGSNGPQQRPDERARAADGAIRALERALGEATGRLDARASAALDAPADPNEAFDFLAFRAPQRDGESVVLYEQERALAWSGTVRVDPDSLRHPTSVAFSEFYSTLNVSRVRGNRRAVASAVLAAVPPADRLTPSLASRVALSGEVASYGLASGADAAGGRVVLAADGVPLLRATARLATAEEVRFRQTATWRGRVTILLVAGMLALLAFVWKDRRALPERLFAIGVALAVTALVPWNEFSNSSRLFDPAFYFSRVGGALTANAAALIISSTLVLMAVYAILRAWRRTQWPRVWGAMGALVILGFGLPLASNIVRGIGQPPRGSTPGLWLSWEIPLFLFLFGVLLLAYCMLRIAFGRPARVSLRSALFLAGFASTVAIAALWSTTSRQRVRLAEEDVSRLAEIDEYTLLLARRFASSLADSAQPRTRARLLQLYASSELASAELPATLTAWDSSANPIAEFAIAATSPDTALVLRGAREALASGETVTRSILGPTGVQVLSAVAHEDGGVTSVLVLPRTRLLNENPYAALLGMGRASGGDPPYAIALTDASPLIAADRDSLRWHRIGNELHGDRLVPTSTGTMRAHVEIDLRSRWARAERGLLLLLMNVLLAGLLWLMGAAAERGFARWVRIRASRWIYTYRARLTLALFTFFVIPAVAFALWSYQRLRSDDEQTREVLVRETLNAVMSGDEYGELPAAAARFDTPLFLFSNGFLERTSDVLLDALAPAGRALPPPVQLRLSTAGELSASSVQQLGPAAMLFGYSASLGPARERFVLSAPARSDDLVLDRRRRDLGMLVLFATAVGALAALWLSGIAAKRLARDLELSRIEVARAERVLAWGEMARQVAHEIKNPLTPIRLGVQHLRRARYDSRVNFDEVLDDNVGRILAEIDRLDEIARSFSRYGSAPGDLPPASSIDVAAVVRDVVDLEKMGDRETKWRLHGADGSAWAMGRKDEMRDVLLNVFENARLAGARHVDITVREDDRRVTIETADDGAGIAPAVLPRIFEPHFSTRTTGSGLGLAVTRRLIEAWGGEIGISSEEGKGTRVLIVLARGAMDS